jgi:hypothetical protein
MRNPIKRKPLRNPGDSVQLQILDVIFDKLFAYYFVAMTLILLALLEWFRWYRPHEPSPWLWTATAALGLLIAAHKIRGGLKQLRQLKQGRDGERAVGQFLEGLRAQGAQVLHDLPGDGFNVDHVVVHASGVYAIETKTFSKPDRGEPRILFDGQKIVIPGRKLDRDPVHQVQAAARWLKELITESTGKAFPVRPVVVFPGWFIVPTAEAKKSDVWVLNPKALPAFIEHSAAQITETDVRIVAAHLSRYARQAGR